MQSSAPSPVARWHRLLRSQLRRVFGAEVPAAGEWAPLLAAVSEAYSEAEEQRRIAAVVFQSREGMVLTDARGVILQVNPAFTRVTGYSADEAVGKTTALLKSGRQDADFYRAMWNSLQSEGHWEGEIWNRRKDGGIYPERLSISAIRDEAGHTTHYLGRFSDISDPRDAERNILELAFYDPLTGLPNRRLMFDRVNQALAASARSGQFGAVLLLDLDHFKALNDTRGHDLGDQLLVEVARRLRGSLRETDSAARLGGDEFVVLLEGLGGDAIGAAGAAEVIAEKVRAAICREAVLKGERHRITPSIGVTLFRNPGESADALLKQADLALYQAKGSGRNGIRFYNPAMQAVIDARAALEAGLRRALAEGEFVLHYQPQVDAQGRLLGAEALLRWYSSPQTTVSPTVFTPVAEDTGLMVPIGRWVLEAASRQLAAWAASAATRELTLAVNVSARQFRHPDFATDVADALARAGANPARLRLELTESTLHDNMESALATMAALKALGVGFVLDDFGSGYSSLAGLQRLPLDQIKIDRRFVGGIAVNPDDRAIVQAIITLGGSFGLPVLAEGVESESQRRLLAADGCEAYQGYLFGTPGPAAEIEKLARSAPLVALASGREAASATGGFGGLRPIREPWPTGDGQQATGEGALGSVLID